MELNVELWNKENIKKLPISKLRKIYITRLIGRCIVFLSCILLCVTTPSAFDVLQGTNFFGPFSALHILWGIWVIDMILQLIPVRAHISIGSQKVFAQRFRPIRKKVNTAALKHYILSTTQAAYRVFLLWATLIGLIGILFFTGTINRIALFMITVFFYVCDLICVLIWCPFRLILKNRCCTTCRIFNWDHLMMFSPMIFIGGFFSLSLVALALIVWLTWEGCVMLFPERFWEFSNEALQCASCTDKLCTQYCQKLRQ